MKRLLIAAAVLLCAASAAVAQDLKPAIFIPPTGDGLDVYIATALAKKNVPATVAASADSAQLTLKAAPIQVRKVRVKFGGCVMAACANSGDKGPSVQLLDRDGAVIWTYVVETDDESTKKEVAEDIASNLKRAYFHQ
jgi:hypothetical protein